MKPIVVKQNFNHTLEVLWNAITEVNQMRQWFFPEIIDFRPEVGFITRFTVEFENKSYTHLWEITEVIRFHKITYSWNYEGHQGDSFVTFELQAKDGLTELILSHRGWETFPQDVEAFSYENCVGGWQYFIQDRLLKYLG